MGGMTVLVSGMAVVVAGVLVAANTVDWGCAVVPPVAVVCSGCSVVVCGWAVVGGGPVDCAPAKQKNST